HVRRRLIVHISLNVQHLLAVLVVMPAESPDDALRTLYAQHRHAVLAYAEGFTQDRGQAEDIVQETFLRAWRHLPRLLADGRPLRPWLRQVLRNVLTDVARVARNRPTSPLDETAVEPEVDGGFANVLDRGLLTGALQRLSPEQRQVLH